MPTMALFRYRLVLEDGGEADPPVFYTPEPDWQAGGDPIVAGGRRFEIVDRREPAPETTDIYAVLVVRPL